MKSYVDGFKKLAAVKPRILTCMLNYEAAFFKNSARSTVILGIKCCKIMNSAFIISPVKKSANCFCGIAIAPEAAVYIVPYLVGIVLLGPFKSDIADDFAVLFQLYSILVIIRYPFL